MKKGYFPGICSFIILLFCSFSPVVDITDEQAVIRDIQGEWIGHEKISGMYRHIKLKFSDDSYEGWLQTSNSSEEPAWSETPGETGLFSLSSVIEYSKASGKYRMIRFTILGSCCGDNSVTAWTLSRLVTYDDALGLVVAARDVMTRK